MRNKRTVVLMFREKLKARRTEAGHRSGSADQLVVVMKFLQWEWSDERRS
jgi:hypothetical protein